MALSLPAIVDPSLKQGLAGGIRIIMVKIE